MTRACFGGLRGVGAAWALRLRCIAVGGWGCLLGSVVYAYVPQEGDIVFHTSMSAQSLAVQAATGSPYSHMGIVLFQQGKPLVFEAVQPVKFTPLGAWLDRGQGKHYVVKRLLQPLSAQAVSQLHKDAANYLGKPYDTTFEWSDQRIYCSELVWKLYQSAAAIELAPLAKLGSFNTNSPLVRAKMQERYGTHIPVDTPVISPAAIFGSPLLVTVAQR